MGMQPTGKPGSAVADINVVPLIDVLLVLLIIFMVITPLTPNGLNVQIPQPASRTTSPNFPVVVQLAANGALKINGEESSWEGLGARLQSIFAHRAAKEAFVTGESGVAFSEIARAIDVMTTAGIQSVGLLTERMQTDGVRTSAKVN
jgi:biopolymer transport protein TolR